MQAESERMAQRLVEMDNRVGQMEVSEGEMERRAEEHRRLVHRLEGELKEQGLENRSLRDEIKAATLEKTSLREDAIVGRTPSGEFTLRRESITLRRESITLRRESIAF